MQQPQQQQPVRIVTSVHSSAPTSTTSTTPLMTARPVYTSSSHHVTVPYFTLPLPLSSTSSSHPTHPFPHPAAATLPLPLPPHVAPPTQQQQQPQQQQRRTVHDVKRHQHHYKWDAATPPVVRVSSGDVVTFDCLDAGAHQLQRGATVDDLRRLDFNHINPVFGPVYVDGAEVGDTLEVEILSIVPGAFGWSAIFPGFGVLQDEFPSHYLKTWDLSRGDSAAFGKAGIVIPMEAFCGEIGVAPPPERGPLSTIPPDINGGNIDTRHITAGTRVFLPVFVRGALFSIGDGHFAQGDGEVCGTAIECDVTVTCRFRVLKHKKVAQIEFVTAGPLCRATNTAGYYCTTGCASDLMEATRAAVRSMVAHLMAEKGLEREEAYILCSVAVDIKINECVDAPNWIVGAYLPLSIFH